MSATVRVDIVDHREAGSSVLRREEVDPWNDIFL